MFLGVTQGIDVEIFQQTLFLCFFTLVYALQCAGNAHRVPIVRSITDTICKEHKAEDIVTLKQFLPKNQQLRGACDF